MSLKIVTNFRINNKEGAISEKITLFILTDVIILLIQTPDSGA